MRAHKIFFKKVRKLRAPIAVWQPLFFLSCEVNLSGSVNTELGNQHCQFKNSYHKETVGDLF